MKKLSLKLLAETVISRRKSKKLTQSRLAELTGMNRSIVSRLESQEYTPSVDQLQALSEILEFNPSDLFLSPEKEHTVVDRSYRIAVAGTGYVGLSLAVLLSQHNEVTAVDILPEKVEKLLFCKNTRAHAIKFSYSVVLRLFTTLEKSAS